MPESKDAGRGLALAIGAYAVWGVVPMYVVLMQGIGAIELIGWRVLASLAVAALIVTIVRGWGAVRTVLRDRRSLGFLAASGVAILVNWTVFAYAVLTGHIIETSLGYFLNPILSVVLAVVVLHERLRPAQWVAVGISGLAVVVLVVAYGEFPWIAVVLAAAFGVYGLLKKQVGAKVDAITGFTLETAATVPFALAMLIGSSIILGPTIVEVSGWQQLAVVGFGIVTAVPLMLFSAAARRVSLATLGFTQYLAPTISLLFGWLVMHEPMPAERLAGFGLVWLSLVVLMVDLVVAGRRRRRSPVVPEPAP
ncbi:EamA family transporter RarD [Agrococcus jejuensis]|uniref:Chloramphenicol-sensitive protein RarD n=1 Tax=Agrococcus jejuensis TaxID=399736 RepID=A0A1G8BI54_9MICO|nr:EamA family transporter RarD [Agrococcus jejuensis]SDH32897.1 chloramphenicol-sensitive protein RarD [Agrococcus jejuensis]